MKMTIITYRNPYDGSDVVWNALRIAAFQSNLGDEVSVFFLSDGVAVAHADVPQPADARYDVQAEFAAALKAGAVFKTCGTCLKNRNLDFGTVNAAAPVATLKDLADWIRDADRVVTF